MAEADQWLAPFWEQFRKDIEKDDDMVNHVNKLGTMYREALTMAESMPWHYSFSCMVTLVGIAKCQEFILNHKLEKEHK
jgi:hypothetical protein